MARIDGRANDEMRPVTVTPDYISHAEGSALIEFGKTRVLCVATIEDSVPPWLTGRGQGWITSEYAMLPRAGAQRSRRESVAGKIGGRTHEIQRLIGRSLRAAVDLHALGEHTITLDCDVIQADGGTRTAAITGAWIALQRATKRLKGRGTLRVDPVRVGVAAISVGIVKGHALLDLAYEEDSSAEVDSNIVMTSKGDFIEVQGTAERKPFTRAQLDELLGLAEGGIRALLELQQKYVEL